MAELEHSHAPGAIADRLARPIRPNHLRDWVLGGIDGAITTFAIVAGVAGAKLASSVVIILGVANLLADGISMAASNYSGVKAENDEFARLRQMERRHIALAPEGEREEVRQIFAMKGFEGDELEQAVSRITEDETRWVDFMMMEEFGMPKAERPALSAALATLLAFIVCGAVPLVPYAFGLAHGFLLASVSTGVVFFAIGALKSQWSGHSWWASGLETFAIGTSAAGVAYLVGYLLEGLVAA